MKKITDNQRRLLWWLIDDYACHLEGLDAGSKTTALQKDRAKRDLLKRFKKLYSEIDNYKPFMWINWEGSLTANEAQDLIIKELQMILLSNEHMLSLSRHYMSKDMATELIDFIFEFFLENEIEMKKQIQDLYKQQRQAKYTIACLKNRICCISGQRGADCHHYEHQSSGKNVYYWEDLLCLPLSREWHGIFHSQSNKDLIERYHLTPVPFKLAKGVYTDEEIQKEITEHKNPKKHSDYRR